MLTANTKPERMVLVNDVRTAYTAIGIIDMHVPRSHGALLNVVVQTEIKILAHSRKAIRFSRIPRMIQYIAHGITEIKYMD